MYIPLSELQIKIEDEIVKYPLSKVFSSIIFFNQENIVVFFVQKETNISDTAAERLYRATLPQIPQFLVKTKKIKILFQTLLFSNVDRSFEITSDIDTNS